MNLSPQHANHIVKHAKRLYNYSPSLEFLKVVANDENVFNTTISEIDLLKVRDFISVGIFRLVPYLNTVVKLTIELTPMNNEQLQTFSEAILNAPLLEKLTLTDIGKVGKQTLFSEYFKVKNCSKLRKLILSDVETNGADAVSTFMDLDYFPNLTALHFRGEVDFDGRVCKELVKSLEKQESYYPKGLRKLEIADGSITSYKVTERLLKSLTENRLLETLSISQAPIKNVDILVDFIIYNKSLTKLRVNYSECDELPEMELLCEDNEITPAFSKVIGAFQLNWQLLTIDWFSEYLFNCFEFGTINHAAHRFLVERVMNRNKAQKHINSLMQPILSQKYLSDVTILTKYL